MQMILVIVLAIVTAGCATTSPPATLIKESGAFVVRLQPADTCQAAVQGTSRSHPAQFTTDEIRTLLSSLSAREKVGLLSSFAGMPGTSRLFDDGALDLLASAIQEAFAKATAEEAVVFLLATPAKDSRIAITSGALSIHGDALSVAIANFRHPVRTTLPDVGATDRLGDVKETLAYVRASPCVSVGEQDFALFFDTPRYQTGTRAGSLVRYPERALSIAYRPFLTEKFSLTNRRAETEQAGRHSAVEQADAETIADLHRRIIELEQANQTLNNRAAAANQAPPVSLPPADSQAVLLDIIKRLEARMSELEQQLKQQPAR